MNTLVRLLVILLLPLLALAGCGQKSSTDPAAAGSAPVATAYLADFSDLLQVISTRPGVTDPAAAEVIAAATADAAQVFSANLGDTADRAQFAGLVAAALQDFSVAYAAAEQAAVPVEARAAAVNDLMDALLFAAPQAGVAQDRLELALHGAAAALEHQTAASLPAAGFELMRLAWTGTLFTLHHRIVFRSYPDACAALGTEPTSLELIQQAVSDMENAHSALLRSLESALHDPALQSDPSLAMQNQFNMLAINDLTLVTFFLKTSLYATMSDIDTLIARMNTIPAMAAVTWDTLVDHGVAEIGVYGQPRMKFGDPLVYDWVRPEMDLAYTPAAGFESRLQELGSAVPAAPDLTLLSSPYSDIFALSYDAELCNGTRPAIR